MKNKSVFLLLGLLCLPLLLTSCINFEGQTLTYRYDRKSDRLLVFQIYENICAIGNAKDFIPSTNTPSSSQTESALTENEKKELHSVMSGQRTFFFANWIFEYNREGLLKAIEDEKAKPPSSDPKEVILHETTVAFVEHLTPAVAVANGGFYFNGNGQLCGFQYITISNVSKLLPQANTLIGLLAQAELSKTNIVDQDERVQLAAAIKDGNWIQLEGNQIRVKMFSKENLAAKHDEANQAKSIDYLGRMINNLKITYNKPLSEFTFGHSTQVTTELCSAPATSPRTNLVNYVLETYGIKTNVPLTKLRDQFLKTGNIP